MLLLYLSPGVALAQEPGDEVRANALRVFLDCEWQCDSDYFRTEISFVNWVRDRTLAQVHVIVTASETGGGGNQYALDFIGLETLEGQDDRLTFTSLGTDTDDETRTGLTQVLGVGLARYSALIGEAPPIEFPGLDEEDLTDRIVSADQVEDPWNFWVFEIGGDLDWEGEETEKGRRISSSVEARRTTEIWKFEFEADGNFSRDEIERSDGTVRVDDRTNWDVNLGLAYALADHWSLGVRSGAEASTRRNQDLGGHAAVGVEYSVFPYEEAPRRSLTAQYGFSLAYFNWEEETIFRETSETRPQHQVQLQLFQRQPWGSSRISVNGNQFLHDLDKTSLSLYGELEFRIVRGLDLDVELDVEWLNDQLFISGAGLTDEDIFLGRFDRPTDFTYEFSIGLSFEFGSIFNNVVNNRF